MPTLTARALFAQNLKHFREKLSVSQTELSRSAGLAKNTVGYIETKQPNVRLDTVSRLAISLDVDPCSLLAVAIGAGRSNLERDLSLAVAANLKLARGRLGLTQDKVATAAGLAPNYVYKIEAQRVQVTLDTLDAVGAVLGLPVWQLVA
jgi:transcriptional regulator with XRE-family HTH domain